MRFSRVLTLALLLSACSQPAEPVAGPAVVLPIDEYFERTTYKVFGQYVSDRFTGYHAGDDIEYTDTVEEVPVYAIADGVVMREGWVSGYGGLLTVKFIIEDREIYALYGHINLSSSSLLVGQEVKQGDFLANLGEGESEETDGERKHLHFALYEGGDLRVKGYVDTEAELAEWIDPSAFLSSYLD